MTQLIEGPDGYVRKHGNRYEWIICADCTERVLTRVGGKGRCKSCSARRNGGWKGQGVTYSELHNWVARHRGRPSLCEHCGTTEANFEWANISGEYKRDLADWMRLCKSCHERHDAARRGELTGRRGNNSKLTADIVREARERNARGETKTALAMEYGVGLTAMSQAINRVTWDWVI